MAIKVFPLTERKDKDLHKTLNLVLWCCCLEESDKKKSQKVTSVSTYFVYLIRPDVFMMPWLAIMYGLSYLFTNLEEGPTCCWEV